MRPALTPVQAPDQPGQRNPTLLQDLGTVAHLYGAVFWMLGQRLQHGRRWEQKLAAMSLRSYGFGTDHDSRRVMRHPN